MRVLIIGGGPGGLYLAQLLKRGDPGREVVVAERNQAQDTFGFGVVFSDNTLQTLAAHDRRTHAELEQATVRWDAIDIHHRGTVVTAGGNGFSSVGRMRLLSVLQRMASDAGAELRFAEDVTDPTVFEAYDLVVAADGANSTVRDRWSEDFGTKVEIGTSRFIWFGTTHLFEGMTFIFAEDEHGWWGVHAYPFDDETSTFLVETGEETWRSAGFDALNPQPEAAGESDLAALAYFEHLFAPWLDGGKLLANNSKWRSFPTITNDAWHRGNVVLLGDAAHTAHFSVGSGTKMALEDAVALAGALDAEPTVESALATYEAMRRPGVERVQRAAEPSLIWWERMAEHMERDPSGLATHFLTRTPRVSLENLRMRDAGLVARLEREWEQQKNLSRGVAPLATPFQWGALAVPNRVVTPVAVRLARLSQAQRGAGVIVLTDASLAAGRRRGAVARLHERTAAILMARVECSDGADPIEAARTLADDGFDALELAPGGLPFAEEQAFRDTVAAARDLWPADLPLAVRLPIAEHSVDGSMAPVDVDRCVAVAASLVEAGAGLITVAAEPGATQAVVGEGAWRALLVSERIRSELGVATMLDGCVDSLDAANTAIMSGRADLCMSTGSV